MNKEVTCGKGLLWKMKHSKPMPITDLVKLVKKLIENND